MSQPRPFRRTSLAPQAQPGKHVLHVTLLPSHYTPGIPEFLPGMLAARGKGQDVFLFTRSDPEEPDKKFKVPVGYLTGYDRLDAYRITYLYVCPGFRAQGAATTALSLFQRDRGFISCTVPERNLVAQKLLRRRGFRCLKTIPDPRNKDADSWYFFQWENPLMAELDITPPNWELIGPCREGPCGPEPTSPEEELLGEGPEDV